jgi:hypothetical protein
LVKLKMDMAKNINQRPYVPFAKVMEKQWLNLVTNAKEPSFRNRFKQ